jgi:hypothetical protein
MEITDPQEIFKQDNEQLAHSLRKLVTKSVNKAIELVDETDNPNDLYTAIKIAEISGKITGIVQEKQQINMQINQISGFTFIETNKDSIIQIDNQEGIDLIDNTDNNMIE